MSTPSRATLLNKLQKAIKRTYKYTPLKGEQPVLESLLFACCLENTHADVARASLDKLRGSFFDWNEIRVSTVKELAEVITALPEPAEAAARLKGVLQGVFESDYSFDLETLKKQNIGVAVKRLRKLPGATSFGVAYTTQTALGGHAIPLDKGTCGALVVLGIATEAEAAAGSVAGLERAIPKSKGYEFGALVHELGADFFANPFSPALRDFLVSITPDARERFPKRSAKKPQPEPEAAAAPAKGAADEKKKKEARREKAPQPVDAKAQKTADKRAARAKPVEAARKKPAKALARRKPR